MSKIFINNYVFGIFVWRIWGYASYVRRDFFSFRRYMKDVTFTKYNT